jgi:ABC-type sugar transport system ATPase subunit
MNSSAEPRAPVVEVKGLSKSFGHVRALKNVGLKIFNGEIVALVGDNGAGK